ncbi:DnaB-like helicase N-terminal domain-containing protein [Synechocystis sp. LKSZ1]|uniref:DnaB-like helicase N-terminal domain-containing protein n=1 Tax=Synechocystis sp. LKSZ1 TaxID=3144951 RepID=UPI00336BC324
MIPPHSIELERAVIGCILFDSNAIQKLDRNLIPDAFYVKAHQTIYREVLKLHRDGFPTDLKTLATRLQERQLLDDVGGIASLSEMLSETVGSGALDRYVAKLNEKYARRQVLEHANDLVQVAKDESWQADGFLEFVNRLQERIGEATQQIGADEDKHQRQYERLVEEVRKIEQTVADPGLKLFKMQALASRTGHTTKFLNHLYLKNLAAREVEPMMGLKEVKEKYGSSVQEWFLHGFGPAGSVVLLHAHGGVGKTRLIYDWIYSMVRGESWEGHHVTAPTRRALIVQTDESQGDMLNALDHRGFTDDMPVKVITRWTADHMAALRVNIEQFRPEVILIDSLTSINRNSLFSENDTEYARPVLELRDIAQEYGCLIYLVHHSNSEGGSRGTKAIAASVSHIFSLSRPSQLSDPTTSQRILAIDKSRSRAPGKYELEFNPETGGWSFNGEAGQDSGGDTTEERILEFLEQNRNKVYEASEIHAIVGGESSFIRRVLNRLAQNGRISRRKSATNGRAYVYWLGMSGDEYQRTVLPNPSTLEAQMKHTSEAHFPNPDTEPVQGGLTTNCASRFANFSGTDGQENQNFEAQKHTSSETQSESDFTTVLPNCASTVLTEYQAQLAKNGEPVDLPPNESRRPPVLKRGDVVLDQDYRGYWLDSFHKNVWWAYREGEEFVELRPDQIAAVWKVKE